MQPLFHPDRFAHANLFVADVEESVAFYRDVCGITEVFREPGIKAGFLSNANETVGRDKAVLGMLPAEQGLKSLQFAIRIEKGLICELKLIALQRISQAVMDANILSHLRAQLGGEALDAIASVSFRGIESGVGILQ